MTQINRDGAFDPVSRAWLTRRALLRLLGGSAGTLVLSVYSGPGASRFGDTQNVAEAGSWRPILPTSVYGAAVPAAWFDLAMELIRTTPGFSPPVASRALAYLGLTLYEALLPGMPGAQSLAGQLHEPPSPPPPLHDPACHWPSVANTTLATLARRFFSTTSAANLAAIEALERAFADDLAESLPHGVAWRSRQRGRRVALHIFAWSTNDGGHQGELTNFPGGYLPPSGAGLWEPTPPGFLPALQPSWGENRPFVIASSAKADPGTPPAYSTAPGSAFYSEALEVYEAVNNLTDEQRQIAHFWADDPGLTATPPGHWIAILNQVIRDRDLRLDLAAESYARVGMALADAFICCWHTKYRYHLLRPISFIQAHIDPAWGDPLPVTTPPFPEYTSGHSVQSAAAAEALTALFGEVAFSDRTHERLGYAPRAFSSFWEAAEEAAISRLYGGIHFRAAIERGIVQGRQVGSAINAMKLHAN